MGNRIAKLAAGIAAPLLLASCATTGGKTTAPGGAAVEEDFTPAWAKEAIWYQIFPERFRNGSPANDPRPEDIAGAWPSAPDQPWQVSPWGSDWYKLQPWEEANGRGVFWNIPRRRYGGDLLGVAQQLDYLQELGVTAVYFNPLFMAPSHHKYDGITYHHIDPTFGPDPEGDRALIATEDPGDPSTWLWTAADRQFLDLIKEMRRRGIRVIIDGVFNHMGKESWPFQDVKRNQRASRYADWFTVNSWDHEEAGTKFDYEGWFGVKDLPELREDENGIVAGPREYIFAATRRWMDPDGDGDPSDGIDGWRLDVAFCVAHPFWKDWRKVVKGVNPQAYITAEVIDSNAALQPYLQGDEFDAVMNYNFAFTLAEFFVETKTRITAKQFDAKLLELREAFPAGVTYVQQNLFGSHDTIRIGSAIVNRDLGSYRDWGGHFGASKAETGNVDTRRPTEDEYRIQKLIAIMQFTYVGAPMIYYGDEVGMWGANDPCDRKPMVWGDLPYEPEATNPDGSPRVPADPVGIHRGMLEHYKALARIRNGSRALRLGDFQTVLVDDHHSGYAFSRSIDGETAIVAINNSAEARTMRLPLLAAESGRYRDALGNSEVLSQRGEMIEVRVPAYWGAVLLRE
ncbi:MAG: glycoside hydrolase family 13 protein [Candidatus Sumerlaeia bacterium]|nr:glycoside hydrolase family 13 protein [Candidatus Sumerlaeia bacterium]